MSVCGCSSLMDYIITASLNIQGTLKWVENRKSQRQRSPAAKLTSGHKTSELKLTVAVAASACIKPLQHQAGSLSNMDRNGTHRPQPKLRSYWQVTGGFSSGESQLHSRAWLLGGCPSSGGWRTHMHMSVACNSYKCSMFPQRRGHGWGLQENLGEQQGVDTIKIHFSDM